jgi:hypothetical protein
MTHQKNVCPLLLEVLEQLFFKCHSYKEKEKYIFEEKRSKCETSGLYNKTITIVNDDRK